VPSPAHLEVRGLDPEGLFSWKLDRVTTAAGEQVPFTFEERGAPRVPEVQAGMPVYRRHAGIGLDLPPGTYDLMFRVRLDSHIGRDMAGGADEGWRLDVPSRIRVLPQGVPTVELVDDPQLLQRVRQAIRIKACYLRPTLYRRVLIVDWEPLPPSSPGFYYDISVQVGSHELAQGWLRNPPGDPVSGVFMPNQFVATVKWPIRPDEDKARIVMTPNAAKAGELLLAEQMPREPIRFEIELQRFDLDADPPLEDGTAGGIP
jgi:hypothetical protein